MEKSDPEGSDRNAGLSILRERLGIYAALYQSDDLDEQREAVWSALAAVTDFLAAQGFPPETLLPILRPGLALIERENNALDQMFVQRARGGRPKATMGDHERTGILAAFANAWLRAHENDGRVQGQKLAEAARKMRGPWFGKVTPANLKSAREIVSQEAASHPAVVMAREFDEMFADAEVAGGIANAFEYMVRFVNQSPGGRTMGILKTPPVLPVDSD